MTRRVDIISFFISKDSFKIFLNCSFDCSSLHCCCQIPGNRAIGRGPVGLKVHIENLVLGLVLLKEENTQDKNIELILLSFLGVRGHSELAYADNVFEIDNPLGDF